MARPMSGQIFQLQKETTPGTAVTSAMKRVSGLRARPGFEGGPTPYKGITGKVATSTILNDTRGQWPVDGVQDFNAIGYVLASRISNPTTTTPGGGTNSRQHVFTYNPNAADTFQTYTAQFGDTTVALQGVYGVFNTLTMQIQRQELQLGSSFLSRTPSSVSLATAGTSTIASVPIPAKQYDVWADDTWATLGTTKLLACYQLNLDLGDKFAPDAPINSAVASYESVLERQDQSNTISASFGLDATSLGLITGPYSTGALKFFRIKAVTTNFIETTIPWSLQIDFAAVITEIGEIGEGPAGSGAVEVPVTMELASDGANSMVFTLVNLLTNFN